MIFIVKKFADYILVAFLFFSFFFKLNLELF